MLSQLRRWKSSYAICVMIGCWKQTHATCDLDTAGAVSYARARPLFKVWRRSGKISERQVFVVVFIS